MTVKRKKKGTFLGGRTMAVAFSLCLLAVITMIGMYTVGRTDQKKQQLEDQIAKAEQAGSTENEIRQPEKETEKEKETQEAASSSATRLRDRTDEKEEPVINSAELESNFQEEEIAENIVVDEMEEAASSEVMEEISLLFSPEEDKLFWPVAGNIILDYSMDKSIYFTTLDQYKYNPAIIIEGTVDESVMCGAQGQVTSIEKLDETGTTVTLDIGNGYELIYGQLKEELPVKEGDYVKAGETVGYVSEPTKYYTKEGCNVYFEVRKDGKSIDPMPLLQ